LIARGIEVDGSSLRKCIRPVLWSKLLAMMRIRRVLVLINCFGLCGRFFDQVWSTPL
jgi:hypothetical protein